jgi:exonuclease III
MGYDVVIVTVYAPSDHAPDNVKEAFEIELTTILSRINSKKEIIIMGDMNSRVGKMKNGNVVDGHGEEDTNNNGEILIQIYKRFSLKIMNGYYSHKDIHKYPFDTKHQTAPINYTGLQNVRCFLSHKKNKVILIVFGS